MESPESTPNIEAAAARLAEAKAIAESRPPEDRALRDATIEDMFLEIRARIGVSHECGRAIYIGWCEGEFPKVSTQQFCHGTQQHAAAAIADLLAKMPQGFRGVVAQYEMSMRRQSIDDNATVKALREGRAMRKLMAANRQRLSGGLPPEPSA